MSNSLAFAQPPSPPHSTDGEAVMSASKELIAQREPYTPPRSIRPAFSADASLDPYGDPSFYQTASTQSYYPAQPTFVRTMHYHTPPMAISASGVQTRSGRALGSPLSPNHPGSSGSSRSPRTKKAVRKTKTGKMQSPLIDQPLSILTKDYKIPVKDMHAWVHRPAETRIKELEKKKGYISRPMNSFMLYRSAYADRVKQFCKENNHQVVSQVTGASWPLEPKEIREMYEKYAMIERDNHHSAHPDYKFAPNKNGKKRSHVDDDDSDDDPDWEGSTRRSAKRSRTNRRGESRSLSATPFEKERIPRGPMPQYHQPTLHPSSYQAINPHGPAPVMVGPEGLVGRYYQTTVTPYGQHVDDVKFGRMDDPFPQYDMGSQLVGLPNSNHHDLLNGGASAVQVQSDMLDPRLAQYDPNIQYQQYETVDPGYEVPQHYEYTSYGVQPTMNYPHESYPQENYPQEVAFHPGMATLTDGRSVWTEPGQIGAEFDEEFQKWN